MKNTLFLLSFFTLLAAFPVNAQIIDSYYFMADDGVQTPEEMEEEALYVFERCDDNSYKKIYFNCGCIAGEFLKERERLGSIAPQEEIVYELYHNGPKECANTTVIAGESYKDCLAYSRTFREYKKNNEEYCNCVGKTAAKLFARAPYLDTGYIEDMHVKSMSICRKREKNNTLTLQD